MERERKRMIGHDALRIALDNERTCYGKLVERQYRGQEAGYASLKEQYPELFDQALERWNRSVEFAQWAMDEYRRSYDTSSN